MSNKIYSFDVFDTVLTRIWAKPKDLFWKVGHQLQEENLISIAAQDWRNLRIEAEKNARQTSATDEVTLQQIYDCLAPSLNWSLDDVEKAKQQEIEVELSSLRPVPATQRKIEALHQQNERVIYISDMYLPQEVIRLFLEKNNIWADGDILYVSSEVGVTKKKSGQLFQHCSVKEAIKASQLNHVGDHPHGDVKVPKSLGIKTQLFTQTHLNRYERLISENEQLPLKFRSLLAGSSRLTRLQCQEDSRHKQVIWETAASVIAPVLLGFVNWCLQEAESKGIQRLYFVARDGQILLKIAKVLCKNWGYNVDCRYLYGSRQAWHFPAIQSLGEQELDWIFEHYLFVSVRSVCERVNITPEQIRVPLIRNAFPEKVWDRNLENQERSLLRQVFQEEPDIFGLIIATAKDSRLKTIGYFKQEGLSDGITFGIVDLGWKGRLQRSLSKLLYSAGIYPEAGTYGFYFGLKRCLEAFPTDYPFVYFHDVTNPSASARRLGSFYSTLLEIFIGADHGSTVRFEEADGKYIPILRNLTNDKALNWGLEVQQKAIIEFVENFSSVMASHHCSHELFLSISESLLKKFIETPTREEAETFGSFEYSPDMMEATFYEVAPELTFRRCFALLIDDRYYLLSHAWKPGVISRSRKITRFIYYIGQFKKTVKETVKKTVKKTVKHVIRKVERTSVS